MMGETDHTAIKELPKSFQKSKIQIERDGIRFFCKKDKEDRENQGEYYILLKELQSYIEKLVVDQEQTLIDNFDLMEDPLYLNDYKKKVVYDDEAKWVFIDEMTSADFRKMVKRQESQ